MEEINQWERELKHINGHIDQIKVKLVKFTEEFRGIRKENGFNEIILNQFKQNLKQLEEEFLKQSNYFN
jgi:hypothetical protein